MLHLISIFTRRSGNTTLVRFEPRKSLVCLLRRIRSMSHSASPEPLSQPWAAQPALPERQAPFFSEQTPAGSKLHIPTRSAGRLVKRRPQEIWRRSLGRFRYRTTKKIIFVSEALTFRAQADTYTTWSAVSVSGNWIRVFLTETFCVRLSKSLFVKDKPLSYNMQSALTAQRYILYQRTEKGADSVAQ